jgi:type IV secretion system protein VirD4
MRAGSPSLTPLELVGGFAVAVAMTAGMLLWTTAQIVGRLVSGGWLELAGSSLIAALIGVVQQPDDPAGAFGPELAERMPGPVAFWTVFAVLALLLLVAGRWVLSRMSSRRAGEQASSAHWATRRDLESLTVRQPEPGRLTLGHGPRNTLLACEPGHSLLVLGPTQSGKTSALAIPAILEWPGPVVATSVKTDLLADTLAARRQAGTVWTYDPTGSVTGVPHAGWTPWPTAPPGPERHQPPHG